MASCTEKIYKILRMGLKIILFCTHFVHVLYIIVTIQSRKALHNFVERLHS